MKVDDYRHIMRTRLKVLQMQNRTFEGFDDLVAKLERMPADAEISTARMVNREHGIEVFTNDGKEFVGYFVTEGLNPTARTAFEIASGSGPGLEKWNEPNTAVVTVGGVGGRMNVTSES